jgi:hypothetical protein
MASDVPAAAQLLQAGQLTPISQLNPGLPDQASRVVRGVVTIVWPFSSVTGSVAFRLAEPDFRLRGQKGQVRLEFRGASAKAILKCNLGSGDEVVVSLDGVEWAEDATKSRAPGASLEWMLKFQDQLILQVRTLRLVLE